MRDGLLDVLQVGADNLQTLGGALVVLRKLPIAVVALLAWSTAVVAQDSFSDPASSGPLVGTVHWLEGTLLGTIATVIAVIAIASVGLLMLRAARHLLARQRQGRTERELTGGAFWSGRGFSPSH